MQPPEQPSSSAPASSAAVRRLRKDLEALQASGNPQLLVRPSEESLLEWHFVLHSLPNDTPYSQGCYHGKILFPSTYPHAPPAIIMITPSGRLETGKRLCLSMTDFHPESWNPAWSVETILVGLLSFFISSEKGYGAVQAPEEQRRKLAAESWQVNAVSSTFTALFPEFQEKPAVSVSAPEGPQVGEAEQNSQAEASSRDLEAAVPDSDEPTECWICRDTTDEPLIQPCLCRGSMSGVHASCVEEWIRHHRRTATNDAPPMCSVCHQPYHGSERIPGVRDFVRHKCRDFGTQCCRTLLLVLLLMTYQVSALNSSSLHLSLPLRILGISAFAVLAIYRLMVLLVSLPPYRLPPENRFLLRFFISEPKLLALHIAEAAATITVMAFWCISGFMSWIYFAPFAGATLILMAKLFCRQPSADCVGRFGRILLCILVSPVVLVGAVVMLIRKYPHMVFHPLGPGPHLLVAIAVVPMALTLQSNLPLLILWGTHSLGLTLGLVELFAIKRFRWKRGVAWGFVVQATLLACYLSNICVFPAGLGDALQSTWIVAGSSVTWMLLLLGLCLKINWELCLQYYRTWQRRHGSFTLNMPAEGATQ